ncbi:MAG: DUF3011 domain-containing protein [Xanthomonadales bacterium]|nr:DUF3011 domain-containing protein [Xanthomonadales bacterium]
MKLPVLMMFLCCLSTGWARAADVTCESVDSRRTECEVRGSGEIRLVEQLSRADCRENRDWGTSWGRVWVANGCRAVFEREDRYDSGHGSGYGSGNGAGYGAGYGAGAVRDGQVTCESIDKRRSDCALYGRGRIRMVEQLSRSDCHEGSTWGADRDGVWVSGGCRAVFERTRIAEAAGEVTCESIDNRRSECALYGRGQVRLVEQLSRSDCREGRSWGSDRDGVWVSNGCRGVFQRMRIADGDGEVTCESIDNRRQECALAGRGNARLTEQLSRTNCREGVNWGSSHRGVWVSGGCRGVFQRDRDHGGWPGRPGYGDDGNVTCESIDNRRQECRIDTRGDVMQTRQLSSTQCVRDRNWGVGRGVVWVSGGCRAEFVSEGRGRDRGASYEHRSERDDGDGLPDEVTCESINNRQSECAVDTRYGIRLLRQLSSTQCIEKRNWGAALNKVWVSGGCRGVFGRD